MPGFKNSQKCQYTVMTTDNGASFVNHKLWYYNYFLYEISTWLCINVSDTLHNRLYCCVVICSSHKHVFLWPVLYSVLVNKFCVNFKQKLGALNLLPVILMLVFLGCFVSQPASHTAITKKRNLLWVCSELISQKKGVRGLSVTHRTVKNGVGHGQQNFAGLICPHYLPLDCPTDIIITKCPVSIFDDNTTTNLTWLALLICFLNPASDILLSLWVYSTNNFIDGSK